VNWATADGAVQPKKGLEKTWPWERPNELAKVRKSPRMGGSSCEIFEVWAWNFESEFSQLLSAMSGDDVVLAMDTEFAGFMREEKQFAKPLVRYAALRQNCDHLRPIQLGISVADGDGTVRGTWCFNLLFNVWTDLYTEASMNFLAAAGLDFERHASEGIDPVTIGPRLLASPLGGGASKHRWVTFQGAYDFGYMLRLLTGRRLPANLSYFEELQVSFFPNRYELRDELPRGSLDSLLREFGVERCGTPHTAGSDALATLELYFQVTQDGPKRFRSIAYSEASTSTSFHTDGTGSSGSNYFQNGGYSYNYWNEDQQVRHGVGAWDEGYNSSMDMPPWEETSFVDRTYPQQGRWPLLSTPGPQMQDPVEPACRPEAMQMLMTGTRSTGASSEVQQASNLMTTGLDGSLLLWAVPVQAPQTGVIEHMPSEMTYANGHPNGTQMWLAVIAG